MHLDGLDSRLIRYRFQKVAFLVSVFAGYVWTEGESAKKTLRFQTNQYTCGRGLKLNGLAPGLNTATSLCHLSFSCAITDQYTMYGIDQWVQWFGYHSEGCGLEYVCCSEFYWQWKDEHNLNRRKWQQWQQQHQNLCIIWDYGKAISVLLYSIFCYINYYIIVLIDIFSYSLLCG